MALFGLSANEFVALNFIQEASGRTTGAEVGAYLGTTSRTGERIISRLCGKGYLVRISRGRYAVSVSLEPTPVSVKPTPVSVQAVVGITTSSRAVVEPNGSTTGGTSSPREEPVTIMVVPGRISDNEPNGISDELTEAPEPKKKTPSGWRERPRSEWTVAEVAKEFGIRGESLWIRKGFLYPVNLQDLTVSLRRLHKQHGVSVADMLQAMDDFFAYEADRMPNEGRASGWFLNYLDEWNRRRASERTTGPTDPYRNSLNNEGWV